MLNLFKNANQSILGLDIGDLSLKLVQLDKNPSGDYSVQAFSDEQIPKAVLSNDLIKDPKN